MIQNKLGEGAWAYTWAIALFLILVVQITAGCDTRGTAARPESVKKISADAITFGDKFYDVVAPDKDHLWAVGYFGAIVHSSDGGKTFVRQDGGTFAAMTGVSFINDKQGWAVGDQGTILHTKDGGLTWEKQKSPLADQKLLKVQFLNDKEGFAIGTFGLILSTNDGGATWERLPYKEDVILNDLFFFNSQEGYVAGEFETILHTANGGKTWEKQRGDQLGKLFGIAFKDPRTGIAVGTAGKIVSTSDGRNWTEMKSGIEDTLLKAQFVGSRILAIGLRGVVLVSENGRTWSPVAIPGHYSWLSGVSSVQGVSYLVGNEGKILASNDVGKTWTRLGFSGPQTVKR